MDDLVRDDYFLSTGPLWVIVREKALEYSGDVYFTRLELAPLQTFGS